MLTVEIAGKNYDIPNRPEEMPLGRFLGIVDVERTAPAKYKALLKCRTPEETKAVKDSITITEYQAEFLPYFAKWLTNLTGIKADIWYSCKAEQVESLYRIFSKAYYLEEPKTLPKFIEHDGEKWFLPELLMLNSTLSELVETAQLQSMAEETKGNFFYSMPRVLCILLRKEGEIFTPAVFEREEYFKTLPMSAVWIVDFFLQRRSKSLGILTEMCSIAQEVENLAMS